MPRGSRARPPLAGRGPAASTTRREAGGQPLTHVRLERLSREADTITLRLRPRISAEPLPDGSRTGHVAGGPLRPLGHLPVVLTPRPSDPAAGVRRLAPDRPEFAPEHVDARPGETVTLVPFAGIHNADLTAVISSAPSPRCGRRGPEPGAGRAASQGTVADSVRQSVPR
ncbi:DUF4986 domain-containing protein [Streptomyces sp. DH10]|uniref:DUF4986 domain-containing protein n=1 Tax=Streptomyces sp. DH10 TaxID=3040121 RepID=UPI003FA71F5C